MERRFDISEFVYTVTDASIIEILRRVKSRRKSLKYT